MTDHVGIISRDVIDAGYDNLEVHNIEDGGQYYSDTAYPAAVFAEIINRASVNIKADGSTSVRGKEHVGIRVSSVGDNLIYHRVWVEPLDIDAGFITEEAQYDVKIWNADEFNSATITAVASILPDGTEFSLTDAMTPVGLGLSEEKIYIMVVEQTGPPIQDTYYTITIDGIEYEIYVHGLRVIPLEEEPDWAERPTVRYVFQTSIAMSTTYDEQRRALTNRVLREELIKFAIQNNLLYKFKNSIIYGHDKVFGVPLYSEVSILASSAAAGTLTLTLESSCEFHWNLQNLATHIILADYDTQTVEIKEIDTISNTQITTARGLINSYPAGTLVYPCFFATLKALRSRSYTDNTEQISIEFKEYILGST